MPATLDVPHVTPDFDLLLKESPIRRPVFQRENVTKYVAGFLFDSRDGSVVLIRKRRPAWQAGKYNGVGGKVEPGETPADAMRREFREETGHDREDWDLFCSLRGDGFVVHFFRAFDVDLARKVVTKTDEEILVLPTWYPSTQNSIPNLLWLIPMAFAIDADRAGMFEVREIA